MNAAEIVPQPTRWKVVCAYDGSGFAGWQSQPGGLSVQDVVEARLLTLAGTTVRIHGSGRTDAGVHARAQVFHFDLPWRHGAAKLKASLRVGLPSTLQIKTVQEVPATFHARFSAVGKRYEYRIFFGDPDPFIRRFVWGLERPRPLDVSAMQDAARRLVGKRDFAAFSAKTGEEREDTVKDLRRLDLIQKGRQLTIVAEADGFLYKMVRSLVGALVSVGLGKVTPERISELLVGARRLPEVETAPPQG
ncbi:MAG TPA: tRNA pseudouridine(38-40) synthase TruA, partial [Opitutaceae bacterium]|nr:tRNA pseudouridine(38-40) synthase TruA [Opitutaceae bacterium]